MSWIWNVILAAVTVATLGGAGGGCRDGGAGDSVQAVVRRALPATVRVSTLGWAQGTGSGFLVRGLDGDDVVVTNSHVVAGASSLTIELADGRAVSASVMGSDPAIDLAILRPASRITVAPLSLEDDRNLEVGDRLVIIGSPAGMTGVVTAGILSARTSLPDATLPGQALLPFIITDAVSSGGSSGSPVLDQNGRVVGVSSALVGTGRGLSIVLPGHVASRVAVALQQSGAYAHSYAGMTVATAPPEERREGACLVTAVATGGPANLALVRVGDRVVAIDGVRARGPEELTERSFMDGPGKVWNLDVYRGDAALTLRLALQVPPDRLADMLRTPRQPIATDR